MMGIVDKIDAPHAPQGMIRDAIGAILMAFGDWICAALADVEHGERTGMVSGN